MAATTKGYLGIDNGTQGLSVLCTDENLKVLATGEATYDFVPNLPEGCYEQRAADWDTALSQAMKQALQNLSKQNIEWKPLAIGISGQMHGQVLVNQDNEPVAPVRLWCDARNADVGEELTTLFGCKIPKRVTAARFLWTARQKTAQAVATRHITTPAGWCAYRLTGEYVLGIGDASGMFPIRGKDYDVDKLKQMDDLLQACDSNILSMRELLPTVKCTGEDAGSLTPDGATLLGLSSDAVGIPVAPAEGDQIAALAGSLIGKAGTVSCSFGTSVCANAVGDRPFQGVSPAVDQYCAADGAPLNMVWLRNGTTFLNTVVESFGSNGGDSKQEAFAAVMPEMIAAPADCGGLLALPFMDDEPGLQVHQGGSACIVGWNAENAKAGNVAKAALLSTMFNLRLGCQVLDLQGYPRTELVLTGGLSKTQDSGQILADVFDTPVTLLAASADEGCSWGAAVMAKYRHLCRGGCSMDWSTYLTTAMPSEEQVLRFIPDKENAKVYEGMFERYQKLAKLQSQLADAVKMESSNKSGTLSSS